MPFLPNFNHLPWTITAIILIATFVLFTIIGILVVRKTVNLNRLKNHHDVAGFVFANLGVLYAVLLGFTVVNVQERFDKVKGITRLEAAYLDQLYQDAAIFPEKNRTQIRNAVKAYCESVLDEEWTLMAQGISSPITIQAFRNIWEAYYEIEPNGSKEGMWYAESIRTLNQLMNTRISRILGSKESLGAEMWTLLLLGAIVMVTFVWFFGLESITLHILMASILATTVAFLLFLIYSLDSAFSGQVTVSPEAFMNVLRVFQM